MRLGRVPSGDTPSVLELGHLASTAPLPTPPSTLDWTTGTDGWPLLGNDVWGDCTVAAVQHYVQAAERWRDGVARQPATADSQAGYRLIAPGWDGETEGPGARIIDLLTMWRDVGLTYLGQNDRIDGFVRVQPGMIKVAGWLFGPVIVGALLPIAAQAQDIWSAPASLEGANEPGGWGGHCMLLTGWRPDGSVDLITWGEVKLAEPGWVDAYIDEAWSVLHPAWVASGLSPAGWHRSALDAAMIQVESLV